jgi:hypothetical protein
VSVCDAASAAAAGARAPAGETLLVLDTASVASWSGVTFALNQARKHPLNPVLLPSTTDTWDSLQVSWPATVLYSPEERLFRCWYAGLDAVQAPGRFWQTGYAESTDGRHWTRPRLGQALYLGHDTNRIVLPFNPGAMVRCVFAAPEPSAAGHRFGCLSLESARRADGAGYLRTALGWSADGRAWTHGGVAYEAPGNDRPAYQDIFQIVVDRGDPDPRRRVKGFSQILRQRQCDGRPAVRHIGLAHGPRPEQLADAEEPVLLGPEAGLDEELHGGSVYQTAGLYLMLFESCVFSATPLHGDIRLAVSDDGRRFRRVHPQTPFVATGPRGTWDENLLVCTAAAVQEVGDELYIFYVGCPNVYSAWPLEYAVTPERRGSLFYPSYLGVATVGRDRFGYAAGPGSLTTRPLAVGDAGVWLNAEGEGIAVEALAPSGVALASGTLGQERLHTVYRRVVWGGGAPAGVVQFRLTLDEGSRLYSIRT